MHSISFFFIFYGLSIEYLHVGFIPTLRLKFHKLDIFWILKNHTMPHVPKNFYMEEIVGLLVSVFVDL